ncbi:related to Probable Xaa-Pro aminopeptidase PEPP [Lecanosticta acicola]|uniref:Xaa-Pro aminopeptidase n=1 Tax=Lecanosticta acicola TaxID=111012 RepID=A0AAI9EEM2_9PEZI|nr:related to Probable Xaa-Pro aminopeptidase PEPP [Lecanosticta acicola]
MTSSDPIANPNLPSPPSGKYPAKAHARRVAKWIAENGGPKGGVIYLEGQGTKMTEDDDQASHFRQRRHFYYLTGCDLPDCFFAYDIASDRSTLWIPPVDPEYVMWAGMPLLPDEALERYDIDAVLTSDELKSGESLVQMLQTPNNTTIFAIQDRADLAIFHSEQLQPLQPRINHTLARRAIEQCRVVKDDHEIALLRHANAVSSYAHEQVLANAHRASNERELHALFVMHCHANNCKEQAYGCICAAGTAGSTLHYIHNDQALAGKHNILLDAGAEFQCYCADITRTFPITPDGTFTPESKQIYDLVHRMQAECFAMIRAGVLWEDVHMRAHTVAAEGLRALGIFYQSLSTQQILDSYITTRFFPHGLGHYLGMDTHDVGGNANYEDPNPYFAYLRVRGRLPAGAVITNEPGIYFRSYPFRAELKEGKWDGIVDQEVLARYWAVGGVRIEDDVVVREDGYENLTTVRSDWEYVQEMVSGGRGREA